MLGRLDEMYGICAGLDALSYGNWDWEELVAPGGETIHVGCPFVAQVIIPGTAYPYKTP